MLHIRTLFTPCLLVACLLTAAPLAANGLQAGDLRIGHPWTRAAPAAAKTAAGYLKITNNGAAPDKLVSAAIEAAEVTELHEMSMTDNVMRMRKLDGGIEIKPGETVELKPGGSHLMMIGLKQRFQEGGLLKGTLTFEKAGTVAVEFKVEPLSGKPGVAAQEKGHSH